MSDEDRKILELDNLARFSTILPYRFFVRKTKELRSIIGESS